MPVVVVGLSYRTCPVEVRERLAFSEAALPVALREIREGGLAEEAVIVSTCNRVEIYASCPGDVKSSAHALRRYLLDSHKVTDSLDGVIYMHGEPDSVAHLFRVASGLDSMVLGETEILGQIKKAYDVALQNRSTARSLNKAFQRAFNVAKQIRTETSIQRGSVSVGSVAVDLAGKIFDSLDDTTVMVIGAGDTSEKTARALLSRGAKQLLVTNRSFDRAQALATELGGRAVPFEDWTGEFAHVDIIISSTSAPGYVIDRARLEPLMQLRDGEPLLLIDIAVPRDIDPAVNLLEDVYVYDIDDLQTIADDAMRQRQDEIARCESIIRARVEELLRAHPSPAVPAGKLAFES